MNIHNAILELAQELIQTKGYNSFSYADISKELNIKRASIHYYYPQKADLGKAVMIRYTKNFKNVIDNISDDSNLSFSVKIGQYFGVFTEISGSRLKICLGGALGGEYQTLPEIVQTEVKIFFDLNLLFLEELLKEAQKNGEFSLHGSPTDIAYLIFSSLEGGLIVARSHNKPEHFLRLTNSIKSSLINNHYIPNK